MFGISVSEFFRPSDHNVRTIFGTFCHVRPVRHSLQYYQYANGNETYCIKMRHGSYIYIKDFP